MTRPLIIAALLLALGAGAAAWVKQPVTASRQTCACHGEHVRPPAWHTPALELGTRDAAARLLHGSEAAPHRATCGGCHQARARTCASCHRPGEIEGLP